MMRGMRGAIRAVAAALAVLAAIHLHAGTAARAAAPDACTVSGEAYAFEPALPRTVAALIKGDAVSIVAVGGASTLGRAAGSADKTWPARLAQALASRFPKARISVFNVGVLRDTAAMMVARFGRDVLAHKPTLVIWETGTTDAVRSTDIDAFRETVQKGIADLRAAVPEVILMDMQYSQRSELIVNLNRYVTLLRGVADMEDVPLFPRHDIMRGWSESGVFDYGIIGREARRDLAQRVYGCIGQAMADFITRGAGAAAPK